MALVIKALPANAGDMRDEGLIPGSGRSPAGGHSNPFQYSCLGNSMYRGAWQGYGLWGHKESDMTEQRTLTNLCFMEAETETQAN